MKSLLTFFIFLFTFSCAPKKVVELPQVNQVDISKISDISAAYLFYEPGQGDGIELNRKNLISTTNWVVNVDKRLTLNQAIPKIIFLQDKKRNATHKNAEAKNYYTCDDLSQNTLGFIEFTEVHYHLKDTSDFKSTQGKTVSLVNFETSDRFELKLSGNDSIRYLKRPVSELKTTLDSLHMKDQNLKFTLRFKGDLAFQDYISVKSKLAKWAAKEGTVSKDEFIFN
ncbi:hypothetical protein [Gaetbulibacter aestuarii]|uniref:Lipoprotein n=1 Tax=Gaetbulibacter aestuarii TaxID=1502358 RepID=A0ABW7MXN8_9FLAO